MNRIEKDGKVYFEWEPHEVEARQRFESVLSERPEGLIALLLEQYVKLEAKLRIERQQLWKDVHDLTQTDPEKTSFTYHWISGRLELIPDMSTFTEHTDRVEV